MTTPVVRTDTGRSVLVAFWLAAMALSIMLLPGCGGCAEDPVVAKKKENETKKKQIEDAKKAKKEAEEKDFEISNNMQPLPAGDLSTLVTLKPGHWYAVSQQYKSNKVDFLGEMRSFVGTRDGQLDALPLDETPFRLEQRRPVLLAKKQAKQLEMLFYLPRKCTVPVPPTPGVAGPVVQSKSTWLHNRLLDRTTSMDISASGGVIAPQPFRVSPSHQYEFVVLSRTPERYGYLKTLPTIEMKTSAIAEETNTTYYQIIMPLVDKRVPVPSHPLAWTSVAYVLWDDLDPASLTPEQQDALVDWLHWGGQILVSGPSSLAALRSSFLGPLLPVTGGNPIKLTDERLKELSDTWTLAEKGKFRPITVVPEKEPEGIDFTLHAEGTFTPGTGKLVAERQIGRGRILVTSFSLSARELVNWPHFDGFVNGCLLRRPARKFVRKDEFENPGFVWDGLGEGPDRTLDPRFVTHLRYWSRDLGDFQTTGVMASPSAVANPQPDVELDPNGFNDLQPPRQPEKVVATGRPGSWTIDSQPYPQRGYMASADSGVAGWNDFSGVATAARDSLSVAAGIKVPERTFVLQMLLVYLVVLIPLNWGFFRLIGRVEWAWAAAPVIALAGAVGLVRMVQLDIGFVRSRVEIGVLEIQGNHPRGHLTRYTALYTSLTTAYENHFNDNSALVLPFSTSTGKSTRRGPERIHTVDLRRDEGVTLRGFPVDSNATGFLHSEEMLPLGGGFELTQTDRPSLINGTTVSLQGAALVRRNLQGRMEVAWIGNLKAGESKVVAFQAPAGAQTLLAQWEESPTTSAAPTTTDAEINLRLLLNLAQDPRGYLPGDVRLLAWTDEELGKVTYDPPASQNRVRTLVVANLRYAPLPEPLHDTNSAADVKAD